MNKKLIRGFRTNMALSCICLIAFTLITIPFSIKLAIAEALVSALVIYVSVRRNKMAQKSVRQYLDRVSGGMDSARSSNLLYAPLPMLVFDLNSEEILWGNDAFVTLTDRQEKLFESTLFDVVPSLDTRWLMEGKRECPELVNWNDRVYRVFGSLSRGEDMGGSSPLVTLYWMDVTESEKMRQTLELTRPVVGIIMVDNYEELMKACPEGKRSALTAELEEKLNTWVDNSGGLLLSYDRDRYLYVFEEKDYSLYAEQHFALLEKVREVESGGVNATLSIGIGRDDDNYDALFKKAGMALEMALSRGGDQAVIKDRNNFEFFGGRSKATEKRTKVKSRVMANALSDLMGDAKHIYVMGHKYADMDSLGAAAGICCIARKLGKKCQIVIDTENNAAQELLARLREQEEYRGAFIGGSEAFLRSEAASLLIVVDTNRPDFVESPQLLDACTRVAVIDHHRRAASYIEDVALNYHEPYASSASELVTELLQYIIEPGDLLKMEAEALLAGIVLDTKNFKQRTGGRTFEAAAYLRRSGADTNDVHRMFQGDLSAMISRFEIIRHAEMLHEHIALAVAEEETDRIIAAQASDAMLDLKGVDVTFVVFRQGSGVGLCARSAGEVNVQVILERLGGGGNSTMAGGFVENGDVQEVAARLRDSIERYLEEE